MPDNSKEGWGKGCRSLSCIGRRHKNKFWKKKVDIELLSVKHLDGIADDRGEEHTSVDILDQIEEEEISCEVPKDLEDIADEIVAEMDDSPREADAVSTK